MNEITKKNVISFDLIVKIKSGKEYNKVTLQEKLEINRVININNCWLWTGSTTRGYGQIRIFNKTYLITRISLHLFKNFDLKSSLYALHTCDNPTCFNPEHLYVGNQCDNMEDSVNRKRSKRFTTTHCPKGHGYTIENTKITTYGSRACKICAKIYNDNYRKNHGK